MSVPKDFMYTKTHEWVEFLDGGRARIGITDFAQSELGDIVYVNLPVEGDVFAAGDVFADVESVKTAEDIYSPIGGKVSLVNTELAEKPELVNDSAFEAWFAELEDADGKDGLMTAEEYEAFLAEV